MNKVEPSSPRVRTLDLLRHFSEYSDEAMKRPVVITKHGRDRFVLMTVENFRQITEQKYERKANEPDKTNCFNANVASN